MPNHLAGETSPYLLQHANNPVDWRPWNDEALAEARTGNQPILLSIGYAACHWCHVMAHESFEDSTVAAFMNEHFVCIKVDREERPDLDAVYMQAVQAMTGRGGWPMTVFLTPAGEPFYGGTYFPPVDRHGMPSFTRVLKSVSDAYSQRPETIAASVASMRRIYAETAVAATDNGTMNSGLLDAAVRSIASSYDSQRGGFGEAPKFPPTMVLDFLLRHWARTGETTALDMASNTFIQMSRGGIFDQVGGGFARYSVDADWLVPHFEKMLYDNALLIRFGAHLYEATHDEEVRRITTATVTWLTNEMTAPDGGFYSSLDADSEGAEGRFYVWTDQELDAVLGDESPIVKKFYGVTSVGNFEGSNILHVPLSPVEFARQNDLQDETLAALLARARAKLLARRAERARPTRDDKIIAGWNGLGLRAVADAARAFDSDEMRVIATRNAEFLLEHLVLDGRCVRRYSVGANQIPGFLDDQAAVALGFLAVFEQTLDIKWLDAAKRLASVMLDKFRDSGQSTFYDTADDAEQLVSRPRDPTDNATPSGTSLAVDLLLRLANYGANEKYRDLALDVMNSLAHASSRYPTAFGHLLGDAEYAETFACHGDYCDMPSPRALDIALESTQSRQGG